MMLTDPVAALAEQSNFIGYLVGSGRPGPPGAHARRTAIRRSEPASEADDFVHLLLGLAGLGDAIERLANSFLRRSSCRQPRRPRFRRTDHAVAAMSAVLAGSDFLRAPVLAAPGPRDSRSGTTSWCTARAVRLLINFSLTNEVSRPGQVRLGATRHRDRSRSAVDAAPSSGSTSRAGRVGRPRRPDHRRQPDDRAARRLPRGDRPARQRNSRRAALHLGESPIRRQQPAGGGRPDVLAFRAEAACPRVAAHRRPRASASTDDVAYHDHNWGRFQWGGDFGWTWGTILPAGPDDPWSMVFLQMTDRRRLRCLSTGAVRVAPRRARRDHSGTLRSRTRSHGLLGRAADCTLPPPMRLVLDGEVSGVPAEHRDRRGSERATRCTPSSSRSPMPALAQPSEVRSGPIGRAVRNQRHRSGDRVDQRRGRRLRRSRCIRVPLWLNMFRRCCGDLSGTSRTRCPTATGLLLEALGPMVVEVDVDGELFSLRGGGRLRGVGRSGARSWRRPDRQLAGRHPGLLDARVGLDEAVEAGTVRVQGSLDDVLRAHDTLLRLRPRGGSGTVAARTARRTAGGADMSRAHRHARFVRAASHGGRTRRRHRRPHCRSRTGRTRLRRHRVRTPA